VLFLLRPPQTRMPFVRPRDPVQQETWNEQLQAAYDATRRVPSGPSPERVPTSRDTISDLKRLAELHSSGALTAAEFAAAKARVLAPGPGA